MKVATLLTSLLLIASSSAIACGHCIEDKVAAVYDYALVSKAVNDKHTVAFFGIEGPLVVNEASKRSLQSIINGIKGVDSDTARISLETGSFSVAFSPSNLSYTKLLDSLDKKLKTKNLTIFPLDTITQMPKPKLASR